MRYAILIEKIQRFKIYVNGNDRREAERNAKNQAHANFPDVPTKINAIDCVMISTEDV